MSEEPVCQNCGLAISEEDFRERLFCDKLCEFAWKQGVMLGQYPPRKLVS